MKRNHLIEGEIRVGLMSIDGEKIIRTVIMSKADAETAGVLRCRIDGADRFFAAPKLNVHARDPDIRIWFFEVPMKDVTFEPRNVWEDRPAED